MWRDRKGGTGEVEPNPPTDLVQLIGVMVLSFAYESRAGCILGWFSTVSRSPTRVPPHAADRPWWIWGAASRGQRRRHRWLGLSE